jgi:hypothetical protein
VVFLFVIVSVANIHELAHLGFAVRQFLRQIVCKGLHVWGQARGTDRPRLRRIESPTGASLARFIHPAFALIGAECVQPVG